MSIKIIVLVSVAFLNFALGLTILTQNVKSLINRWFAAFAFSLGFWSFSMMMYESTPENWTNVFIWSLILHLAGALIAHSFFYIALVYPDEKIPLNKFVQLFYYIPIILITHFLFINRQIIIGLEFNDRVRTLMYGPIYYFYFTYFFLYMGGGLLILFLKLFKSHGKRRKMILIFLLSVSLPLIYSGFVNMILVALGDFRYAWTGPIALFIVVITIVYSIIKYNFLNVKVIATQVIAVLLSLVTFTDVFSNKSTIDFIIRIGIFIITITFAVLLIRLVQKDVKRREEMELLSKDLRKVTKNLEKANDKIKRIDQAKLEFLSIASHQLRTPLTVIKGYVSMMLEGSFGKIPKLIKTNLTKVYAANERLINLVENLLNISRMEAGRLEFNIKSTAISEIIKTLVPSYVKKFKKKKIKLNVVIDKNIPKVLIDADRIKEVIVHFIDNAIKYTDQGSINLSLSCNTGSVVFSCQDTGMGIAVEKLPDIFNQFIKKNNATSSFTGDNGLDLYFSKMVIENMNGKIWVESDGENKGANFLFSIPISDVKK